ncbi:MAG: DNA polymerase I [Desulfovibrio sp.]|nr:DNA polymerase I [Desulfovibrio sp.]
MSLEQNLGFRKSPIFLMDGTAFIYRSYYANRHLRRSDGFPTNALVLVTRVLLRILRQERPQYFLFAMDGKGRNLRKDIYAEYKANREAMPEDLSVQIEPIKSVVRALGLTSEVVSGHEADDCIASLANRFAAERPVVIVSGDKDLKQCLGPDVVMWDPGTREEKLITAADFEAENGVRPDQWADVQALTGDSSDNIPGVPGIGPKTARQIFEKCVNLEDIRDNLDKLPEKLRGKLAPHLDAMFLWRKLTALRLDACPNLQLEDLRVRPADLAECEKLAREFELNSIYRDIASLASGRAEPEAKPRATQAQLPGLPPATPAPDTASLPACEQLDVALVWPEGLKTSPRIAIGRITELPESREPGASAEYAFSGKQADLCAWLANAALIIVPDFKQLLTTSPSWRKLLAGRPNLPVLDLGLCAWLLDPEDGRYSWINLATRWQEQIDDPAAGPAKLALMIAAGLQSQLAANELQNVYREIELPLVPVLADMQERGFAIDPAAFRHFLTDVEEELGKLSDRIYAAAGEKFNISSSRQLGEILFGKLGLPDAKRTKTGQPSTSQATLEKLAPEYPLIDTILEYRKLEKMRSTYLDPLPRLMDASNRIHSTFNQEATATGRISSSDPNLQNIPVRGPLGARMRACFVAAPGNLLIAADYSQIELRVLAHLSQDQHLLEAFRNGEDIHTRTASLIFDTPPDLLEADQRRMAKTINFGLLYGMGARKLSQELKISASQAKEFIDRYFAALQGLKAFYAEILKGARENIFVKSMAGRKRWLPDIHSANGQALAQAERQAINAVIQGTAADIMKLAMLAVANDSELRKMGAGIVLQVHDELLLEAPENIAREAAARVAQLMEAVRPGGIETSVPLRVDWGVGNNWAEAH